MQWIVGWSRTWVEHGEESCPNFSYFLGNNSRNPCALFRGKTLATCSCLGFPTDNSLLEFLHFWTIYFWVNKQHVQTFSGRSTEEGRQHCQTQLTCWPSWPFFAFRVYFISDLRQICHLQSSFWPSGAEGLSGQFRDAGFQCADLCPGTPATPKRGTSRCSTSWRVSGRTGPSPSS